ncbi:hypothetical protein C8R45DRAFT_1094905 [Mycena sanguinolenta]|nr:hypothetical protein C8R45DRAFT_1094905 [Mycena sanguinolenta]
MHPIQQYLSEVDTTRTLEPGTPQAVDMDRHSRQVLIPPKPTQYTIDPFTDPHDASSLRLPDGWTACLHPEGALYFLFEDYTPPPPPNSTEICVKRIFTDSDILKPESLHVVTRVMHIVADFMRSRNAQIDACVDWCGTPITMMIKHWGATSDMFPVTATVTGITSESRMHIQHELTAQYWRVDYHFYVSFVMTRVRQHCYLFPAKLEMTHQHVDGFRDIVLYSLEGWIHDADQFFTVVQDLIVSTTSTVPWKVEQLTQMLHLADGFSKNVGTRHCDSICSLSRLMHLFVRDRVYNFHGEPSARLNSNQNIYPTERRTLLVKLVNPLLFFTPGSHLTRLNTIYTDKLIRHRFWSEFITALSTEWQELATVATVVLNANVSFLSIQSVDQGGAIVFKRSPA